MTMNSKDYSKQDLYTSLIRPVSSVEGQFNLHLPDVNPNQTIDEFYSHFDPLLDADGNEIKKLGDHQREVWNHQFVYAKRAYPKSQKIYFTTTFTLEDIIRSLTNCMGFEIVLTAQSDFHAQNHLSDFKKLILQSEFHDYLITQPVREIGLERNEITKASIAYLWNKKNPFYPTKVYAFGFSAAKLLSLKRVKHVHASDITISGNTPENQDKAFASLHSRLANTQGSFILEAPPRGMTGPLYSQYEGFEKITKDGIDLSELSWNEQQKYPFFVKPYDYTVGLENGCFTPEFIEGQRMELGPLFDMYYGAKFYESDQSWYTNDMFETSADATDFFGVEQ